MVERKAILIVLALATLALPATALALALGSSAPASRAEIRRIPTATRSSGVPEIGALYSNSRATRHTCTASVVQSPRGNTIITAAHCVVGSGVGMVFAPGERGSRTPYGRWTVTAAHLEPEWITRQDPDADVAFLTVAPRTINGASTEIEQVTGAYDLGPTVGRGQQVTITGYAAGSTNNPIICVTKVYLTKRFPSFDCRGFVGGTSGAPWLRATPHGAEVVGVIGGPNQGGCYDHTSYSSRLTRDVRAAYDRASKDGPVDVAPPPGGDGC